MLPKKRGELNTVESYCLKISRGQHKFRNIILLFFLHYDFGNMVDLQIKEL